MTSTCQLDDCPLCRGEECRACGRARCLHDPVERHNGMQPINGVGDHHDDTRVIDVDDPPESRVPTRPLDPVLEGCITIHADDGDAVLVSASIWGFVRLCRRILDAKGQLTLSAK